MIGRSGLPCAASPGHGHLEVGFGRHRCDEGPVWALSWTPNSIPTSSGGSLIDRSRAIKLRAAGVTAAVASSKVRSASSTREERSFPKPRETGPSSGSFTSTRRLPPWVRGNSTRRLIRSPPETLLMGTLTLSNRFCQELERQLGMQLRADAHGLGQVEMPEKYSKDAKRRSAAAD